MSEKKLITHYKETYIEMIKNSTGSKIFNSLIVSGSYKNDKYDVLNNGDVSCAYFVSGLLTIFNYIDTPHATVTKTEAKLLENSWKKINTNELQAGDIIVWDKMKLGKNSTENHLHIGFYLDLNSAISTSAEKKKIIKHHPTYGINLTNNANRKIVRAYRNTNFQRGRC